MEILKKKSKRFYQLIKVLIVLLAIVFVTGIFIFTWHQFTARVDLSVNVLDKTFSTKKHKFDDFGLKIDKISVNVPIVPKVDPNNESVYNSALFEGIAQARESAVPGGGGNIFLFGHSGSFDAKNPYGQTLVRLNELEIGDEISVFYHKEEHKYKVSNRSLFSPFDLSALIVTKNEQLTIMTCWPPGTIEKRLVVVAKPE